MERISGRHGCDGQMDLFSYMGENARFCWDDDVNEIVKSLRELAAAYNLEVGKEEFTVWDHVPRYGYRLWLGIKVTRAELGNERFRADIENIAGFAESRNVELTPMWGACMFFNKNENEAETADLYFTTLFMDKQRQRRK